MKQTIEPAWVSNEYDEESPEHLVIEFTPRYFKDIEAAKTLMAEYPQIRKISLDPHPLIDYELPEDSDWRIGCDYITVFPCGGSYLELQNKYDASSQVEFVLPTEHTGGSQ